MEVSNLILAMDHFATKMKHAFSCCPGENLIKRKESISLHSMQAVDSEYSEIKTYEKFKHFYSKASKATRAGSQEIKEQTISLDIPTNSKAMSSIPLRTMNSDCIILKLKHSISKYIQIVPDKGQALIHDLLHSNFFRVSQAISLSQREIKVGTCCPELYNLRDELFDIVLGYNLIAKLIFTIEFSKHEGAESKDRSFCLIVNHEHYSETSFSVNSLQRSLGKTILESSSIPFSSTKLYHKISKVHKLENMMESIFVLGNSLVLCIKAINSQQLLIDNPRFESSASELNESSEGNVWQPKIQIIKYRIGSIEPEICTFIASDLRITIGRSSNCGIKCEDSSVSKIHATIFYCTDLKSWVLVDGDGNEESANGIWILIKGFYSQMLEVGIKHYFRYERIKFCIEVK